jgi:hypothetical protein
MGRQRGVQYRLGSFYRSDDRSGFVVRAENTKQEWQNLIVDKKLWEPRQPQDFVKGVPDDQSVPDARSKLPEPFQGPISTTLTADVAPGATFLPLASIANFGAGDSVGLMLDSGSYFNTTVSGPPTSLGVNITTPCPGYAASGNIVTDYEHSL